MYSHRIALRRNVIAGRAAPAGMGLGLKDSGAVTADRNEFTGDTVGIYLDQSPGGGGERNRFTSNTLRACARALVFHASESGNHFADNVFSMNRAQVTVEGGGDAMGSVWEGNRFDDYQGYDLDGDGVGDVPYVVRSLSTDLRARYASLDLFDGSPVLALIDAASYLAPMFAPRTILIDRTPRTTGANPQRGAACDVETPGRPSLLRHHRTLARVNLTIPSGARVGLVGPNGSGKSTLLRCMLGLVATDGVAPRRRLAFRTPRRGRSKPGVRPSAGAAVRRARARGRRGGRSPPGRARGRRRASRPRRSGSTSQRRRRRPSATSRGG